jgi:hypothetical protein
MAGVTAGVVPRDSRTRSVRRMGVVMVVGLWKKDVEK